MLCSVCHKNMAVIFTKKIDGNKTSTEGLCMDCARAKGINPIDILVKQANLSEDEIKDLTSQFEGVFNEIQEDMENMDYPEEGIASGGIPLGSIFSNMFGSKTNEESEPYDNKKRVKIRRKICKRKGCKLR